MLASFSADQQIHAHVKSIRTYNKFKFVNYDYAYYVRGKMHDALVKFDDNKNGLFSEDEIKQALVNILNENPNELHYVIQNVFRYDKDGDRAITYQ
jgi:hypothetical protein